MVSDGAALEIPDAAGRQRSRRELELGTGLEIRLHLQRNLGENAPAIWQKPIGVGNRGSTPLASTIIATTFIL